MPNAYKARQKVQIFSEKACKVTDFVRFLPPGDAGWRCAVSRRRGESAVCRGAGMLGRGAAAGRRNAGTLGHRDAEMPERRALGHRDAEMLERWDARQKSSCGAQGC